MKNSNKHKRKRRWILERNFLGDWKIKSADLSETFYEAVETTHCHAIMSISTRNYGDTHKQYIITVCFGTFDTAKTCHVLLFPLLETIMQKREQSFQKAIRQEIKHWER